MAEVTRRFITGDDSLYFVSNGVIVSDKISHYVDNNSNWMDDIILTGDNVGWNSKDTALMVTSDDKIYRVDYKLYLEMLDDKSSVPTDILPYGSLKVKYNNKKYSDEFLRADCDYKKRGPVKFGKYFINFDEDGKSVPSRCNAKTAIIAFGGQAVFTVTDGEVDAMSFSIYADRHGDNWMDLISNSDESIGYIDGSMNMLLIADDAVKRIDFDKGVSLIIDVNTVFERVDINGHQCIQATYDCEKFTDEYLEVSTRYKKKSDLSDII